MTSSQVPSSSGTIPVLADLVFSECLPEVLAGSAKSVTVIGIDGPTAAGKTILADCLAERIRATGQPVWAYRLDWNLADRPSRVADLHHLQQAEVEAFPFEGELHMRLELVRDFLAKVRAFREDLAADPATQPRVIQLDNLYSRADGGAVVGTAECRLECGLVILVEGHYTARTEIDQLIDYNILLLSDPAELLRRKIARVKDYRSGMEAEDYFHRIDVPSFEHHLARFGANFDLVIDNSDCVRPRIKPLHFVRSWLDESRMSAESQSNQITGLSQEVFSSSLFVDQGLREVVEATVESILDWDRHIGDCMRRDVGSITIDMAQYGETMISNLGQRFKATGHRFRIRHTNAFHNVYVRRLPLSLGLTVDGPGQQDIHFLADIGHSEILIQIIWAGGRSNCRITREIGSLHESLATSVHTTKTCDRPAPSRSLRVPVMTPTAFALPSFLRDFAVETVLIGRESENIPASQAFTRFIGQGGVWIHRLASFSELHFFQALVHQCGGHSVTAGNYLIALRSEDETLRQRFKEFRRLWAKPINAQDEAAQDQAAFDDALAVERQQMQAFFAENCPDFVSLDGYLYTPLMHSAGEDRLRLVDQVLAMLRSPIRAVRKRAVTFVLRYFPDLSLPVRELWDDLPAGQNGDISLTNLIELAPSIMAEVYLWLALRGEASAILGANIYDIRQGSLDTRAYLRAAAERGSPVVLQGSLNALGQSEEDGHGGTKYGYLRPKDGAIDLVDASMAAIRDVFLSDGTPPPLFGVGLDHVDVSVDLPHGRAQRFLNRALGSDHVTHFVADGSGLFAVHERSREALELAFERVASAAVSLFRCETWSPLIDVEVCSGELNYCGSDAEAMIPSPEEMELFAQVFRRVARAEGYGIVNVRPMLFVGNLGTVHHDADNRSVRVELSAAWLERLKRHNFISAVLHGTTKTTPDVLARASVGCHKVNIAGDFLATLVGGLPQPLREHVLAGEAKRRLADIRGDMDLMTEDQSRTISEGLFDHCRAVMETIRSPRLALQDRNFFRYMPYRFSSKQIEALGRALSAKLADQMIATDHKPASSEVGYEFVASMIEVPFDDSFKRVTDMLWNTGIRYFHIDVGDGRFIPRVINAIDKVRHLRANHPDVIMHAHIMAENPHISQGGRPSLIEEYIAAGCNALAIHQRALSRQSDLLPTLELIRRLGARPGLIIEVSQTIDEKLWDVIRAADLDWAVVMGVPIGYGGQIFDIATLQRLSALNNLARRDRRRFLIEVDGGLTRDNVMLCKQAGAQLFAGWSIVRDTTEAGIEQKVRALRSQLASDSKS